jgi:uncharacterized protein (TIGR03086 family)
MTTAPLEQLASALDGAETIVAGIRPREWELPTPCPEWTVRGVVNHLVGSSRLFARILGGEELPPREELITASRDDRLGYDPVAAYREAAADLLAAFRADGALDRMVTVPAGTIPGRGALWLRIVESLVHGWDIGRATGRPAVFPGPLVEQALEFTRMQLGRLPAAPPGRGPFAPPQPADDDAPPLDRLAALLGRPVTVPA